MREHGSSFSADIGEARAVDAFSHAELLKYILTCRDAAQIESDILNPMANILRARRFLYFKVEQALPSDRHISGALYSQWDSPTFVDYCDNFYAIDPLHSAFDPWFEVFPGPKSAAARAGQPARDPFVEVIRPLATAD